MEEPKTFRDIASASSDHGGVAAHKSIDRFAPFVPRRLRVLHETENNDNDNNNNNNNNNNKNINNNNNNNNKVLGTLTTPTSGSVRTSSGGRGGGGGGRVRGGGGGQENEKGQHAVRSQDSASSLQSLYPKRYQHLPVNYVPPQGRPSMSRLDTSKDRPSMSRLDASKERPASSRSDAIEAASSISVLPPIANTKVYSTNMIPWYRENYNSLQRKRIHPIEHPTIRLCGKPITKYSCTPRTDNRPESSTERNDMSIWLEDKIRKSLKLAGSNAREVEADEKYHRLQDESQALRQDMLAIRERRTNERRRNSLMQHQEWQENVFDPLSKRIEVEATNRMGQRLSSLPTTMASLLELPPTTATAASTSATKIKEAKTTTTTTQETTTTTSRYTGKRRSNMDMVDPMTRPLLEPLEKQKIILWCETGRKFSNKEVSEILYPKLPGSRESLKSGHWAMEATRMKIFRKAERRLVHKIAIPEEPASHTSIT